MKLANYIPVLFGIAAVYARKDGNVQHTYQLASKKVPATVSVRSTAEVVYPAEIANLQISIDANGASEDEARSKVGVATKAFQPLLEQLTARHDSSNTIVVEWTMSPTKTRRSHYYRGKDEVDEQEFSAYARYYVRVEDLSILPDLSMNITNIDNVEVQWVEWELSDKTKAVAKSEVRQRAFETALESGKDYAKVLGRESLSILEFEEEYMYEQPKMPGSKGQMWFYDGNESNTEPPDVEMKLDVRCKFSTA